MFVTKYWVGKKVLSFFLKFSFYFFSFKHQTSFQRYMLRRYEQPVDNALVEKRSRIPKSPETSD